MDALGWPKEGRLSVSVSMGGVPLMNIDTGARANPYATLLRASEHRPVFEQLRRCVEAAGVSPKDAAISWKVLFVYKTLSPPCVAAHNSQPHILRVDLPHTAIAMVHTFCGHMQACTFIQPLFVAVQA